MSIACAAENRTIQGTQFEIFVEDVFRHYYKSVMRNTVFQVLRGKRKVCFAQIDLCCSLSHFYSLKDKYGLFELKHSNRAGIDEDAVDQLLRSCDRLDKMQSMIAVEPVAVVTNRGFTSGARSLAEKRNVRLINGDDLREMYTKAHCIRNLIDPNPSIDDKIRSIRVDDFRTAPNYVHVHI